jgi:hypothetical protein
LPTGTVRVKENIAVEAGGEKLVDHYWRWPRRMLRPTLVRWDEAERKLAARRAAALGVGS